jgi:dTDP-4-dehydrorhamnose reductase
MKKISLDKVLIAGAGAPSRFDVAKKIVELVRPNVKVNPVPTPFFNLEAKRTINEVLSSKVNLMRPRKDAMENYIRTEWGKAQ